MDINLVKWHSFTNGNWEIEIECIEWHSAYEGKFSRADIRFFYRAITLAYAKLLAYACDLKISNTLEIMNHKNSDNFEKTLSEVFANLSWGEGVGYTGLERILSTIKVPEL